MKLVLAIAVLCLSSIASADVASHSLMKETEKLRSVISSFEDKASTVAAFLEPASENVARAQEMSESGNDVASTVSSVKSVLTAASKIPGIVGKVFSAPKIFFSTMDTGTKKLKTATKKIEQILSPFEKSIEKLDGLVMAAPEIISPFAGLIEEVGPIVVAPLICLKRTAPNATFTAELEELVSELEGIVQVIKQGLETVIKIMGTVISKGKPMFDTIDSALEPFGDLLDEAAKLSAPFNPLADLLEEEITIPWFPETYGRGAGRSPDCPSNEEKDAGLCYPKCRSGYGPVGPVCWQSCGGFGRDDGAFCAKGSSYGRGAGRSPCTGCSGCSWRGCSGCSSCSTSRCRSSEEGYGALCYPKCRSGYKNDGCCLCSQKCPSGMTDIGVSCAKKSYGRGAGAVPKTCRDSEELNGLLCYPKCRAGYSPTGCCTCGKPAKTSFTIGGLADGIAAVMDELEGLPLLGEIMGAIDSLVEAILNPVINAIPGMPDAFDVPAFDLDFDLGDVPFEDAIENILASIQENIDSVRGLIDSLGDKLPSEIPSDCPELTTPLLNLAKKYFPDAPSSSSSSSTSSHPLEAVFSVVNAFRPCPTSDVTKIMREIMSRILLQTADRMSWNGPDAATASKTKSKKQLRKENEKETLFKNTGFYTPKLLLTGFDACSSDKTTSVSSGRQLDSKDMNVAYQQSATFMRGGRPVDRSKDDSIIGHFIQRIQLDATDDNPSVQFDITDCVYNVYQDGNGDQRVVPFRSSGDVAANAKVDFDGNIQLQSGEFSRADLGISGFFFASANTNQYEYINEVVEKDTKTECQNVCGEGAGCRISIKTSIAPHSTVSGNEAMNMGEEVVLNTHLYMIYKALETTSAISTFKDFLNHKNTHTYRYSVETIRFDEDESRNVNLIFGPRLETQALTPERRQLLIDRVRNAIVATREQLKKTIAVLNEIPKDASRVPKSVAHLLRLTFGIRVIPLQINSDKYLEETKMQSFPWNYIHEGHAHLIEDYDQSGYDQKTPPYPYISSKAVLEAKLAPIIENYQILLNYFEGRFRPINIREIPPCEQPSDALGGYVPGALGIANQIFLNFQRNAYGDAAADNEYVKLSLASSIIHEASHALLKTRDYAYWDGKFLSHVVNYDHAMCEAGRNTWQTFSQTPRACLGIIDYACTLDIQSATCTAVTDDSVLARCPSKCASDIDYMSSPEKEEFDFDNHLLTIKTLDGGGARLQAPLGGPLARRNGFEKIGDPRRWLVENADSYGIFASPYEFAGNERNTGVVGFISQIFSSHLPSFDATKRGYLREFEAYQRVAMTNNNVAPNDIRP